MIQRALSICSTYTLLANEFDQIRQICQLNNYPISFVDTCIGIGLTKHRKQVQQQQQQQELADDRSRETSKFVEIPYVGNKN